MDKFTAFAQGAVSTQSHQRHEYFNATEADEDSEKVNNTGYNVKAGVSYSVNNNNTVFANAGLYSRQPFHDVIFANYNNTVNDLANNEDILGLELGWKFSSELVYADVNLYRTAWNNRAEFQSSNDTIGASIALPNGNAYTIQGEDQRTIYFQDQVHMGVELDLGVDVTDDLTLKGFASIGDWKVIGDRDWSFYDEVNGNPTRVAQGKTSGEEDSKVGGAPQTSFGIGAKYDVTKNFSAEANFFYYDQLYARNGGIKLPSYAVTDLNLSYKIPFENGNMLRISTNIYNLFDHLYISKARTSIEADADDANNWKGINKQNQVTFGKTRTWNLTMKYSF